MRVNISSVSLLLGLVCWGSAAARVVDRKPREVHIAFGAEDHTMTFTWVTFQGADTSCVQYRHAHDGVSEDVPVDSNDSARRFDKKHGRPDKRKFYEACGTNVVFGERRHIHTVEVTDLKPGASYMYRVGSHREGWSELFWFTAKRDKKSFEESPLRMLVAGDMGTKEARTLPDIATEVFMDKPDMFLATGDFAYDMSDRDGDNTDDYMSMLQPVSAYVPYMVTPGNHEQANNFSDFRAHFKMPGFKDTESLYYSFNIGPVHVVSYFSEVFFWPDHFTQDDMTRFLNWLEADLKEANKHRHKQPWIIAFGHRPMYCAVSHELGLCDPEYEAIRIGIPSICTKQRGKHCYHVGPQAEWGVENLFNEYGVDIVFNGHKHDYERYLPVYDHKVYMQGVENNTYTNPLATVHITTGAAGNQQMIEGDREEVLRGSCTSDAPWCHTMSGWYPQEQEGRKPFDFSYSRVTVHNATHLYLEQYSSLFEYVIDTLWIVQHEHGSFAQRAHLSETPNATEQVEQDEQGEQDAESNITAIDEPATHSAESAEGEDANAAGEGSEADAPGSSARLSRKMGGPLGALSRQLIGEQPALHDEA